MTTIVAVISDLMFQSRVVEQAKLLGYAASVAETADELRRALEGDAALVALDLHVNGIDWREAVSAAKERGVPLLAFGRHTEVSLLREARAAGCDRVVARSTLVEELPDLITGLASAPAILPSE